MDVGDVDDDVAKRVGFGWRDDGDGEFAHGFGGVFGNGTDFGGIQIRVSRLFFGFLLAFFDIEHIVGEFLLGDDGFFFSANNKIASRVVAAFAECVAGFAGQPIQDTVFGLDHDGELAEIDFFESNDAALGIGRNHRCFGGFAQKRGQLRGHFVGNRCAFLAFFGRFGIDCAPFCRIRFVRFRVVDAFDIALLRFAFVFDFV